MTIIEAGVIVADIVLTAAFYSAYKRCLRLYQLVEESNDLVIDDSVIQTLRNDGCLPYVCVSGTVHPTSDDLIINSHYKPGVRGVVQSLFTKEHKTRRVHGFWTDFHKIVCESTNSMPFSIRTNTDHKVHISQPLEARYITENLQTIYDVYTPHKGSTLADRIFGDVSKGFRNTEKMLQVGCTVLGFGRLVLENTNIHLEAPSNPNHFIITPLSRKDLYKVLGDDVLAYKVLTGIFSCVGIAIMLIYFRRLYRNIARRQERRNQTMCEDMDAFRRARQGRCGQAEDQNLCIICLAQPREIVILNCGHICMCADCAETMHSTQLSGGDSDKCPVCRGKIERYLPIYNS